LNEGTPEPTEEEIRAALDEQLRHLRVEDVVLQTVATLINIAVLRLGMAGDEAEKDLGQAQMAIEAARALLPVTPSDQAQAVQDALSQVQMAFAQAARAAPAEPAAEGEPAEPPAKGGGDEGEREKARSRIWTPPGT
jgi:hypothetical protein